MTEPTNPLREEIKIRSYYLATHKGSEYKAPEVELSPELQKEKEAQKQIISEMAEMASDEEMFQELAIKFMDDLAETDRADDLVPLFLKTFREVCGSAASIAPRVDPQVSLEFKHGDLDVFKQITPYDGSFHEDFLQISYEDRLVYASADGHDGRNDQPIKAGWRTCNTHLQEIAVLLRVLTPDIDSQGQIK